MIGAMNKRVKLIAEQELRNSALLWTCQKGSDSVYLFWRVFQYGTNEVEKIALLPQYPTSYLQPATCNLQPATCHLPPATCNLQPATCNLQPKK
jgi:hypothetical protein